MTLEFITALMQYFTQYIMIFMIERYVFLEKGLPKKKQRIYYTITLLVGILLQCFVGDELASIYIIFIGAHNIFLARKEHKIRGAFIIAPIIGIVNGLVTPFLYIPGTFADVTTRAMLIYYLVIFSTILLLFFLFFLTGKKWRRHYETEMMGRKLQKWELALITIIGIALIVYSILVTAGIQYGNIVKAELSNDPMLAEVIYAQTAINMCWMCVVAFILSVAVIVLVMQGNKRAYYYDKSLAMQKMEIAKQRAEAANEAKSSFLSTMSHEIRTPMNAIVGMTDILLREEHSPQTREYLNNIKSSGNALLTIINDILDFSKIESGKMEIVESGYEPMSVFHDLSMIFFNRIGEKKIELLYDIDPKMSRKLYGDSQRIRQIILNLMNNAIKFTDAGYVKLKAEVNPLDAEHVELCFKIEDSGQGIKEEDIDKLFGSFSQVDQIRNHHKEGSGLGLAICKQLVELMKGTISVESTYGRGSIFSFKIPQRIVDVRDAANLKTDKARNSVIGIKMDNDFAREEAVNLAKAYGIKCVDLKKKPTEKTDYIILETNKPLTEKEYDELEKSGGKLYVLRNPMKETVRIRNAAVLTKPLYSLNFCQLLNGEELIVQTVENEQYKFVAPEANILLVDDKDMNLKVAKGLLEPFKMQIDVAKNGKEAIQKVLAKKYHIVFMDHMMPVMDGVEATRRLREMEGEYYQKLPVVALTANAMKEAQNLFLDAGMNGFVAKPIVMKQICQAIRQWLPEELIEIKAANDDAKEELFAEEIMQIEGIEVEEGIKNLGSKGFLFELLGDYCNLIDSKALKIEKCLADERIKDYTIEVHALKSSSRLIGAVALSEEFCYLEELGNAGDVEKIIEETPKVLEHYRMYKTFLASFAAMQEREKKEVSKEEVLMYLRGIQEAIEGFDLDTADAAMEKLEECRLPEECIPLMEKLRPLFADVAMEDIIIVTDEIITVLEEK